MWVSFRVKDQSQAASHSSVYSGVAEAAVQPAVGVRGGVTASCGSFDFVATVWKISLDMQSSNRKLFSDVVDAQNVYAQ